MTPEEEYFEAVESYILQKRGNPLLLTPKEWSLIREWYEAGIPLEVVIRGIDRGFEKKKDEGEKESLSLRYFRRLVLSEHKRFLKSMEGKAPERSQSVAESKDVGEYLEGLTVQLEESCRQAEAATNQSLMLLLQETGRRMKETVLQPFREKKLDDLQRVEEMLTTLEKEIEQVLLSTISDEHMKLLKEEAMRELKSFEGKLEPAVYGEMVRRALIKSVRKLYAIPRLSLFYM